MHRLVAIVTSTLAGALTLYVLYAFKPHDGRFQFVVRHVTWVRDARHQVLPGRRRHLAVPAGAHGHPVPDRALRGKARTRREGLLPLDHLARGGLPRGVRRPRPLPVLLDVRADDRAPVLPDRALGPRPPGLRRHQVLHLHDGRVGVHAGVDRGPGGQCPCRAGWWRQLRPAARSPTASAIAERHHGALAIPRVRHRLRGEGAAVPAAHLAARRPHRGADRRLGDPGRRHAEARHLRLHALRPLPLPRGHRVGRAGPDDAGDDRHHLRRDRRGHAAQPEAAGGLLVGGAHGLHRARRVRPDHSRASRARSWS